MEQPARTILVIDDDEQNIRTLTNIIAERFSGITILTGSGGFDRATLAKHHLPDLIFVNIRLAGAEKTDTLASLKEEQALNDIPVICYSGQPAGSVDKIRARSQGAGGFLDWPIDAEDLHFLMLTLLKLKDALDFRKSERLELEKMVAVQTRALQQELKHTMEISERLGDSEDRFRALFEKAPLSYQSLDSTGHFLEVNEAWLETLGYDRAEVVGRWFGDFLAPEYVEAFRNRFPLFLKEGKIHSEFYMMHKDGRRRYIAFDGRIGLKEDGSFKQTHCICTDETKRRQAEEKLKESEERFRLLHESAGVGIGYYSPDGVIITYNEIAAKNMNGTPEDFQGKSIFDLFPQNIALEYFDRISKAVKTETPLVFDDKVELPARTAFFLSTFTRIQDSNGEILGVQIISNDITERREAEERLRQLAQVSEASTDFIVIIGADYRYRFANKVYLEARRLQPEEIIGHHMIDVVGKDRFETLGRPQVEAALRGETVISLETTDLGRNEIHHLHVQVAPYREDDGAITGAVMSGRDITAITRAEIQLRKLSQAIEQSSASVVITDPDGTIEYVNPKFTEIAGYSLEESIGQNPRILKSGKQAPSVYEELWQMLSSGRNWKGEFLNRKKNGEFYWESALISPIKNDNGEIINYLAVKDDITERKRTEIARRIQLNIARSSHAAKDVEDLLRTIRLELNQLFDTTNFFVARYFPESDTMKQLLFSDEMDSFDVWDAGHSFSGQVAKTGKALFLQGEEIESFARQHGLEFLGTGSACWLGVPILINSAVGGVMVIQHYSNARAYTLADVALFEMVAHETGLFLERQLLIEDIISAKERAEESEERFRSLHNASFGGIAIHDKGIILECNLGLAEMTGYSVDELTGGMNGLMLIAEKSRGLVLHNVESGYEKPYEAVGLRKNGDEYPLRLEARNVQYKGRQARTVEFRDITDIKQAQEALIKLNAELESHVRQRTAQLEASNREMEAFSYSVSHDLRAPLRAIQGFGNMLSHDHSGQLDAEGRRLLGVISNQTKRMGKLIDDLLSFSRLGRQTMEAANIDLAEIARHVYAELTAGITDRVIHFECEKTLPVLGDPSMLQVVFTNFLSNAIKFTLPRNPAIIEVGSVYRDKQIIYCVKDNGVGFDMKYADKLFGVFQRLHSIQEFEGTGIGLSMVHRIIQHHGGRVWAESKVNQGATFYFTLGNH